MSDTTDQRTTHGESAAVAAEQAKTIARLQDKVDALAKTVASQQRLFDAMFASGQLPPDINRW